ncbi:alpha/beta hydrolase [Nonomuraea sp. NPDC005650]|uniref:alpha/beta hydrolase n=1 Tax=Nonomuraea sp. NPDC005650 TaxID=3157045 RepID=UPI0033A4F603
MPPTVKEMLGGPPPVPSPDAPEQFNPTTSHAAFCNEDPSRLGFDASWTAYQRRLERSPVTGRALRFSAGCAGWPLPVQKTLIHRTAGSLVLSGHRNETISPYEWTTRMRKTIGGTLFTVEDDMHGSATGNRIAPPRWCRTSLRAASTEAAKGWQHRSDPVPADYVIRAGHLACPTDPDVRRLGSR